MLINERTSSISIRTMIFSSTQGLKNSSSNRSTLVPNRRLVTWGFHRQRWASIGLYTFGGMITAAGHHLYYSKISGTTVSSTYDQQWALRFGTALTLLAIGLLRAALVKSYNQYIWRIFRYKTISIGGIDRIISLTSDFTGFLRLELYKQAWLAVGIAGLSWYVDISPKLLPR